MCQLLTLYPFFVGFGVGADGLPLFLFPGRVSWHGGVLGVSSGAMLFSWVLCVAIALTRFVCQSFPVFVVVGLRLDFVWLGRFVPGRFGYALARLAGLPIACLGFSFRQLR